MCDGMGACTAAQPHPPFPTHTDLFPVVQADSGDSAAEAAVRMQVRERPRIGGWVFDELPGQDVAVPAAALLPDRDDGFEQCGDCSRVADRTPHQGAAHRERERHHPGAVASLPFGHLRRQLDRHLTQGLLVGAGGPVLHVRAWHLSG